MTKPRTLHCPRATCQYTWKYEGKSKFIASCPRCKTTITINKANTQPEATP